MNTVALVVLLAQTCVAEIGFRDNVNECVLMWQINQHNADRKGRTLEQQTLMFNGYWRSSKQRARRPWIKHLNFEGTEPKHWPSQLRWEHYQDNWLNTLRAARQFATNHQTFATLCPGAIEETKTGFSCLGLESLARFKEQV